MRVMPRILVTLAVVLAAFVPLRAEADEAHVERWEDWYTWSEEFAKMLGEQGREHHAVEEFFACSVYDSKEKEKLAQAAMLVLDVAKARPGALAPGTRYYRMLDDIVAKAVARGGKGDPRLGFAIGRLRWADLDFPTAYRMFKEVLASAEAGDFDLDLAKRWYFRGVVNRAPLLIQAGRYDEAVEQLESALADDPEHPDQMAARINLADGYRQRQETVTAEKILRELVKKYPREPRPWHTLGEVLKDYGRLEEALVAYGNAISAASSRGASFDDSLMRRADVLLKLGRLSEAERATESYLQLKPDHPTGMYIRAMLHRERGELVEAVRLLRRAHRLQRGNPSILLLLKGVLYERGDEAGAAEVQAQLDELRRAHQRKLEAEDDKENAEDAGSGDGEADAQGEEADAPEKPDRDTPR